MRDLSAEHRTAADKVAGTGVIGGGQGAGRDAAVHLDGSLAAVCLQQCPHGGDFFIAAGQVGLPAPARLYRHHQNLVQQWQAGQGGFGRGLGVQHQPGSQPGGMDGL